MRIPPPSKKYSFSIIAISIGSLFSFHGYAAEVSNWKELSNHIDQGEYSFTLSADLAADHNLKVEHNLAINGMEYSLTDSENVDSAIYLTKGLVLSNFGAFTVDESSGQINDVLGAISGFSSGALHIQGSAMNEQIDVIVNNTVFSNNCNSSSSAGAAISYSESTRGFNQVPKNEIAISDSAFYKNHAGYGGAVAISRSVNTQIKGSIFEGNSADHNGGALVVSRSQDIFIEDTSFINNTAQKGGAIYVGMDDPEPIQFGGGANEETVIKAEYVGGWTSAYQVTEPLNISISANKNNVLFSGNKANTGSDIYIEVGQLKEGGRGDVNLNLGAKEGKKIQFDGDIYINGDQQETSGNGLQIHINKNSDELGEIIFNGTVTTRSIRGSTYNYKGGIFLYRGTVTIGNSNALKDHSLFFSDPSVRDLKLNVAQGKIEAYSFRYVNMLNPGQYSINVQADVDLNQKLVDTFEWGKFWDSDTSGWGTDTLKVLVSNWNVLSDINSGEQTAVVTMANESVAKQISYGLANSGQQAIGSLYIYDVTLLDEKKGVYQFTSVGAAPSPNPDVPVKLSPSDFNHEVYAGAITQKVTQLFQHEISHRLFDTNLPTNKLVASTTSSLNGSIHGGQISLNPNNYGHDINVDYGVTLFSYFNSPIDYGGTSTQVGAYGGFVVSDLEDDINDINSRGAFFGIAAKTTLANLFADWHANIGYLTSDFGSHLGGSSDTENIWLGTGLSLGYEWSLDKYGTMIIPSIDTIYTFVDGKDFKTAHNVSIENGDFKGWEVSPGVRFEQKFGFNDSWQLYGEARYIWSDDNLDLKAVNLTGANDENIGNQVLPGLRYGDYTEINLGFKKDFGVWQIHAGADCRIGDIDGWGAGLAAKWQF